MRNEKKLWPEDPEADESTVSGLGNQTDRPKYENEFLRQQDLAIISTAGQSDTLRWSKKPAINLQCS